MSLLDPRGNPPPGNPDHWEAANERATCRDVIERFLDYMEDALDPDARTELERHVRDCGPCLTYLRTYERSRRLVRDATRNDRRAQPSEHMTERLRSFLLRRLQVERL